MRKVSNDELCRPSAREYSVTEKGALTVVLDNVRSAQNVGSLFRTADAFAVREIILCGITPTPPAKEIHKTALGAELTVPHRYFSTTAEALEALKQEGNEIYAVEQVDPAIPLQNFAPLYNQKYTIILGNEVDGVDEHLLPQCVGAIEIPQSGTKHSLNVSVAGALAMWHFYKKTITR